MTVFRNGSTHMTMLKLFNFTTYGSFAVLYTFFPIYFMSLGLSKLEVGMVMAGGPLISLVANPFWGYLSDRKQNIRWTIWLLIIGNLIITQFVFQLSSFGWIYALMLVFFFFHSPMSSQSNSLILNAIDGTDRKFGEFRLWGSLGYAVIALLTGLAVSSAWLDNTWLIYTFMLTTSLLFTFGMPKGGTVSSTGGFSNRGLVMLFANKQFLLFLLLGIFIAVPNAANSTFVSIYIQELGGSEFLIGGSAFVSALFEVPVFLALDRWIRREPRFMIGCLIAVSALFVVRWSLMSLAAAPVHILLTQLLHCVTFGAYYYLGTTLTAQLVPAEYRASGQAAFAITWGGISGMFAGWIGGFIYQDYGANMLYQLSAGAALLGMFGFIGMLKYVASSSKKQELNSN